MQEHVRKNKQGTLVIAGTRVTLGSIVRSFLNGESPEAIHEAYPSVPLQSVYGAIAFYLANRAEVDRTLASQDRAIGRMRQTARRRNFDLRSRLLAAKVET
ncbi:MAG: DUF433 domain-containing protein [Planctomycetes bacterium]|nr:DUF433 domain-containing protein [Planctomycetota bacterium]